MNREQSPSALPCHQVILVASIAVAPTPGQESSRASFLREAERVNRTAPERRHRLTTNIVDYVVCLKAEFLWHTVLSNEIGEFYTYGIYPYLNRSVCLLMGSPTWWRFSFCSSGSSLLCSMMTWRTALCEFQMWGRRCKQWDSHWFQGPKMRFCGI